MSKHAEAIQIAAEMERLEESSDDYATYNALADRLKREYADIPDAYNYINSNSARCPQYHIYVELDGGGTREYQTHIDLATLVTYYATGRRINVGKDEDEYAEITGVRIALEKGAKKDV